MLKDTAKQELRDTFKLVSLSKIYINHGVRTIAITLWYDAQVQVNLRPSRHLRGDFFFNRAPLLAQARFLHARLALSSRSPHAFLCSPVKHKIMANVPQFAVLDKATG